MVKRPVRLQLITAFQPYIEALEKSHHYQQTFSRTSKKDL